MPDQNDNMDELFRKAAADYPLNTGNPDWSRVASVLHSGDAVEKEKKKRRWFWWFLLIPFAAAGYMMLTDKPGDGHTASLQVSNTETGKENPVERSVKLAGQRDETQASGQRDAGQADPVDSVDPVEKSGGITTEESSSQRGGIRKKNIEGNTDSSATKPRVNNLAIGRKRSVQQRNLLDPKDETIYLFSEHENRRRNVQDKPGSYKMKGSPLDDAGLPDQNSIVYDDPEASLRFASDRYNDTIEVAANGEPGMAIHSKPGKPIKISASTNRLYIGAAAGLDLSTVRLQQFSKTGYHFGGLVGVRVGKRLFVEAGFFYDTKYYFTEGEYFDKSRMNLNPNSKILTVDGLCRMYEIPVSVKYNISQTWRGDWFVTAGFSSYIMKEENYDMLYLYTGSGSTAMHNYEYKNSSSNFLSQLRITGGYSYKLPKGFSIRLEPYVNLPVSGVGYGKLKLSSAGINTGIFKSIF